MADRPSPLPPFAALRAFHAVARLGRFKAAGEELGVTESAVSHQVHRLEAFLGVSLFDRARGRSVLTQAGARYYAAVDPAIAQIREATEALLGPPDRARVTLTVPPSLASLWLIPNLGSFEQECPGVDLQLITTARKCDLRREQIELGLRHGHGDWPGLESEFLFEVAGFPVCAPDYLDTGSIDAGGRADPRAALAGSRLIVNAMHPEEWSEWALAQGLDLPSGRAPLVLSDFGQVLEAAERGLGLAIGRRPLVDELYLKGSVVAPFGTSSAPSAAAYYLCRSADTALPAPARKVHRWLTARAAQHREAKTSLT